MVYGLVSGANRDPRAYERAGEFVIDRKRNHHMGFANGPHRCLGAHLARREMAAGGAGVAAGRSPTSTSPPTTSWWSAAAAR